MGEDRYRSLLDELESARDREHQLYLATVRSLAATVDARDVYTHSHSQQVAFYCRLIACELGLPAEDVETIELAGLLHDIGKIAVPDTILQKPGRLTPEEWEVMKLHAARGAEILATGDSPVLAPIVPMVRSHHERWAGGGYPDNKSGDGIPLGARVIALADAFDTITTARPYKVASTLDEARAEVRRSSGRQFAPDVAAAFLRVIERDRQAGAAYLEPIRRGTEPGTSSLPRIAGLAVIPGGTIGPQSLSYQEQQRLAAHMQSLYTISRGCAGVQDEREVAAAAAQLAQDHLGAESVYLMVRQDMSESPPGEGGTKAAERLTARWGWEADGEFTAFSLPAGGTRDRWMKMSAVEPVAVSDLPATPGRAIRALAGERGWRSGIFIPLHAAGQALGMLALGYKTGYRSFTSDDLELSDTLGAETARALAGIQLQKAAEHTARQIAALERLYASARRQATHLGLINRISRMMAQMVAKDAQSLLQLATALLQRELGYDNVCVLIREPSSGDMVCHASEGEYVASLPVGYRQPGGIGMVGWVAEHCTTIVANDVTLEPRFYQVGPYETPAAELVAPLIHGGELIGVLDVECSVRDCFEPADVQMLETLADQLAVALSQAGRKLSV